MGPGSTVASEIPSSISLCARSFFRSTISFCTTEIRAMNPPNAVLPILRKLENRDHREGPEGPPMRDEFLFFGARLIVHHRFLRSVFGCGAALASGRFQIAKPFDQIDKCLRRCFFETTGNSYFF